MKVLVTAYSCEPDLGSEPGVGWNWVRQIARRHECHLITRANNVDAILTAARNEGLHSLVVHGYDLPHWARFWKRKARGASLYYYLWQAGLVRLARALDRELDFDLVHHLTFVSSCFPAGLAFVDRPFVWGPVGQHPKIPDRFIAKLNWRLRLVEVCKSAAKWCLQNIDPLYRRTLQRSDLILSLSREFEQALDERYRPKVVPYLAVGVEPTELPKDRWKRGEQFDVLYSGRLVDLKGVRLAVESFARFAKDVPEATFTLIGEGPLRLWALNRAIALGLGDRITAPGHLPLPIARKHMRSADLFLFPSFEGAGMVVLEAMSAGAPIVCLDTGGPGRMVGKTRGLRVPVGKSFNETVAGLSDALFKLYRNDEKRVRIARRAARWASDEMSWETKGKQLGAFYERAADHFVNRNFGRRSA